MKTSLITPYTESSINTLKIASLYYDEVDLQQHTVLKVDNIRAIDGSPNDSEGVISEVIQFIDDDYISKIKPLLQEGIVKIKKEPDDSEETRGLEEKLSTFLMENDHLILNILKSDHSTTVSTGIHDLEIHEKLIGPVSVGSTFYPMAIFKYYTALFSDAIKLSSDGVPVLSSSPALYKILTAASEKKIVQNLQLDNSINNAISPKFAFDVIEALMLDVGDLEVEDVLEARNKLKDELLAFRFEMERLQFEFEHEFGREKFLKDGRSIAKARLLPRIKDLERKVESGNHKIFKSLLSILRKPDPYVPMLGTSFGGLPLELSLLISLGIVSTEMAIDTHKAKQDIEKDSLFYIMKVRQKARKPNKKPSIKQTSISAFNPASTSLLFPWQVTKSVP